MSVVDTSLITIQSKVDHNEYMRQYHKLEREYYKKHPEARKNKKSRKEYSRKYYLAHREERLAYQREYGSRPEVNKRKREYYLERGGAAYHQELMCRKAGLIE